MLPEAPKTLDALPAPDELASRRLLSLLSPGGVADDRAA